MTEATRNLAALLAAAERALDPTAPPLTLPTSGSTTGTGRTVLLPAAALRASAAATYARTGGPGQWLLALPTDHIAGFQVLIRSVLAHTAPVATPPGSFSPHQVAAAIDSMRTDVPRYTSLVPTQLLRVLENSGAAVEALRTCAAVLVGGAATTPALLARAHAAGIRAFTTYGMTETCGGCVYDGLPLDGVEVEVDGEGRVWLSGPVLAAGYLDDGPSPFVERSGRRWLRTADAGYLEGDRLRILGRMDDVIVTGGINVHPLEVERLMAAVPGMRDVVAVGVADAEWGQVVTAVAVAAPHATGAPVPDLTQVRDAVGQGAKAPRALVWTDALPLGRTGKVDRRAAAAYAAAALAAGQGTRR